VTKHSDYFVWKDTSERVAGRFDDTSWQEATEFLCIKTPVFFWESSATKKIAKTPRNALSDTNVMFLQNRTSRSLNWFID